MNKNDAKIDRYIQNYENQSKKFWKDYINYCSKNPYTICECKDFKCGRLDPNEEMEIRNMINTDVLSMKYMSKFFDNFDGYKLIKSFLYCRALSSTVALNHLKLKEENKRLALQLDSAINDELFLGR